MAVLACYLIFVLKPISVEERCSRLVEKRSTECLPDWQRNRREKMEAVRPLVPGVAWLFFASELGLTFLKVEVDGLRSVKKHPSNQLPDRRWGHQER
jgi:hypothetical protein